MGLNETILFQDKQSQNSNNNLTEHLSYQIKNNSTAIEKLLRVVENDEKLIQNFKENNSTT